ncbi:TPA: MATE family efflux transporter [Legionella pneumophila]
MKKILYPLVMMAVPMMIGQLAQSFMLVMDTYMLSALGPQYIGALSIVYAFALSTLVFGWGLVFALDSFVSFSYGSGNYTQCQHWLVQATILAFFASIPISLIQILCAQTLGFFNFPADVAVLAKPFLEIISISVLPSIVSIVFVQYLQSLNNVRMPMAIMLAANLLNVFLNWVLIYGHFGLPMMYQVGAALATLIARIFCAFALAMYVLYVIKKKGWSLSAVQWRVDWKSQYELLKLGIPCACQYILEAGFISISSILAASFGTVALAAHQIVLACISVLFMIPLGISMATSVLVGQALGKRSWLEARKTGWIGIKVALVYSLIAAIILIVFSRVIIMLFTNDEHIITVAQSLFVIFGFYQIADSIQVTGSGAMRGSGNTRYALISNITGYWIVGLPAILLLSFMYHYNVMGIWIGLMIGGFTVAIMVLLSWMVHIRNIYF